MCVCVCVCVCVQSPSYELSTLVAGKAKFKQIKVTP